MSSCRLSALAFGAVSRVLGSAAFISSTMSSSPHSLTSCHSEYNSFSISPRLTSPFASFTTARVCGTRSPMNLSPSPYSPFPVLKNRHNTSRCFSSDMESSVSVISFAVVIRLLIKLVFISQNYGFISLRNQTYGYKIKTKV